MTDDRNDLTPPAGPAPQGEDRPASGVPESTGTPARSTFTRRSLFFGAAGGLAVGAAIGAGAVAGASALTAPSASPADAIDLARQYPFYGGAHQVGIQTEPQRYSVYMTFDMTSALAGDLKVLLARWSGAIAQLMQGATIGQVQPDRASAVGVDTGEALGLSPAGLTVTVGLGPGIFDGRYGLQSRRPALLTPLPQLPSDQLQPGLTGGDLSLQACADDPQVAYHAIRDLARMAKGTAQTRWTVMGFGRASAGPSQQTPRNLLGFKDGTRNITADADYDQFVWLDGSDLPWTKGGSYQVVRKIQMNIENWDADVVSDQQGVFGRTKSEGAPLTGTRELDTPDFTQKAADGNPTVSPTAHIALAAHENNNGIKILRRGYNYTDGLNQYGLLDAGLLFIAYTNDPGNFIALQRKLGSSDRLNSYISHIGSALFFVPPGPAQGEYIGQALFA
jgi:deferrochelatase/peroxidase EfeB